MNKHIYRWLGIIVLLSFILSACIPGLPTNSEIADATEAPVVWPAWATATCNNGEDTVVINQKTVDCGEVLNGATPNNLPAAQAPVATEPPAAIDIKPVATAGSYTANGNVGGSKFTPNWSILDPTCKSVDQVLKDHGLTANMVIVHPVRKVSWESCLFVFEFKEEFRGSTVKLDVLGYADTIALVDDDVTQFFTGDPNVTQVASQWGFSARWGRTYQETAEGRWLNPNNSCEWNVREYRFGRYWRLPNIGLPDVPYYTRVGPYMTMPGNTNCTGWVPPALDEIVPQDYLQATAMLGGLAIESQWKHSPDKANWAWKYSGDGTFKWQTVYMPQASYGYVELWVDGGPKKFYATDLSKLMLDNLNVEEFSYHSNPNK